MIKKKCLYCKKVIFTILSLVDRKKFCSRLCKTTYFRGKCMSSKTEFKKGFIPWNKGLKGLSIGWPKGKQFSKEHKKKLGSAHIGQVPANFKKHGVGKTALHDWVKKRLGFPMKCSKCSFETHNRNRINWANKSGEYKRDLNDWIRLCRKCHHEYDDISRKLWKTRKNLE